MKDVIFERESTLAEYDRPEWMEVMMIHDEEKNIQISLQKEQSIYSVAPGDLTLVCSFMGIVAGYHEGRDEICFIPIGFAELPVVVLAREAPIEDFLEAARLMTDRADESQQEWDQDHSTFLNELEALLQRHSHLGLDALYVRPVSTEHGVTRELCLIQPTLKYIRHVERPVGAEWPARDLHIFDQSAAFLQVVGDPNSDYDQSN